jgi:hypothetical protein
VRDVAHLQVVSHTRVRDEQGTLFGRLKIRIEATPASRALDGGYQAECAPAEAGATSGRMFVLRQIESEQRALRLLDALAPQARSAEVRCSIQIARAVAETELDHACFALASMSDKLGEARSAEEGADEGGDLDACDAGEP